MGEVYRARDTRLNRDVALKILPAAFANDPDRVRRFEQEGRAAAALNHPNIVVIYDAGSQDGVFYIVNELLEGETLRERLAGPVLPMRKAIDYGVQIARGLAAAHGKGIIHRDLKPENLFLTKDGHVKILDFGLAKHAGAKPANSRPTDLATEPIETEPGKVLGTVGYMSPEQVRGQVADGRSDLFSLGIVLYEMVSGKRAFTGDSAVEIMNAILKQEPPELDSAAPPSLERIVRRCMEKKPEERFESARDLAFALESVASGTGREKPVKTAASRRKLLLWAGAAVIAAALVVAGFLAGRSGMHASQLQFHRVTFRRGIIANAVFSNDDKTIVYSAAWDGKPYELFSTQESSPESRPLGIKNGFPVSISKNGEMALILNPIVRPTQTPGTLARAPMAGGVPREIAEGVLQADWSPDGTQLAIVRGTATGQVLEYPIGKKLFENNGWIGSPKVSPNGDLIAFEDGPWVADCDGFIRIVDKAGQKRAVSKQYSCLQGLAWSADGSEVWFSGAKRTIAMQLYAIDLQGHERLVAPLAGNFWLTDIAADGRVLLFQWFGTNSMFVHTPESNREADLYWHDCSQIGDLSFDGKQVLFNEGCDSIYNEPDGAAYVRQTDGSPAVRLGLGLAFALSRDGKWAMVNPHTQPAQLLALPLHAGDAHPLTADALHHTAGRWLPDSKRIVFTGAEPGHRLRYYVQDSIQSSPRAISGEDILFDRNADDIVISPDGRWLAVARQDRSMQLLPIGGGTAQTVPGVSGLTPVAFCRDESLLVYRSGEIPARILRLNLKSGKQTPWKDLAPPYRTGLYSIQTIRVLPDCETYGYSAWYFPGTVFVVSGLK